MILPRGSPLLRKRKKGTVLFCLFAFTLLASSSTFYWCVLFLMSVPSFFNWAEDQCLFEDSAGSARLVLLRSKASVIGSSNFPEWDSYHLTTQSKRNQWNYFSFSLSLTSLPAHTYSHIYITLWNYNPSAHELLVTLWIIHGSVRSHITLECMCILIYFLYREEAAVISAHFLVICFDY